MKKRIILIAVSLTLLVTAVVIAGTSTTMKCKKCGYSALWTFGAAPISNS